MMIETLGQYKILEPTGSGAMGDIYRARDTRVGRTVAITVVTDQIASNPDRRERFLRDARAAAAVSHPNIVTLYEVGEEDGRLYLVYEFVQGQTLKTIIGGRPLNPRRAVDLAGQIAEALADAHAADLVHGAITAGTIVVTPKGHAKITDFGLATFFKEGPAPAVVAGLAQDDSAVYRADLFSLGVILFEMLTGNAPAPGAGVPSAVDRSLPREIDPIVAKALGKSGGYESAATLAAELRAIGAVLDLRKEAHDAATPVAMSRSKPKRSYAGWIVLALTLAAVAAMAWWYLRAV
jgi:eukaryotic-like serine/threonine-protein kinase